MPWPRERILTRVRRASAKLTRWWSTGWRAGRWRAARGRRATNRPRWPPMGPHDHEDEVEHRDPTEIAEVVEVGRRDNDIGAGDAEERAQEGEPAGGGGGQRSADPARGSGRGQGAEVAGGLAADQPDGHGEDRERQEGACGGRDCAELRLGGGLALYLDRQAGVGRELAGIGDLLARQRPIRLDEPAGRDLSPAAAAKTVERDERGRRKAVPTPEIRRASGSRSSGRS